jgi:hypothetical protein
VVDLRILGVKNEPAGFLVNLDDPGSATQAELTANITALVVDPTTGGEPVQVTAAVGCPDYIDTITSATLQGSKLCPPESATATFPPPIGPLLTTTTIVPPDMPQAFGPIEPYSIQYLPTVAFGLRPDQVGAFFSPTPTGIPALDQTIAYNRDFGLPAIVNLTFELNGQRAEAIKRVVYWPRFDAAQVPNTNPTLGDPADPTAPQIRFYRHRNETTGNPEDELPGNEMPTISVSARDKLYVEPNYLPAGVDMNYLLRVREPNPDGKTFSIVQKTVEKELLRFQFYATAGRFDPELQFSELNPLLVGGMLHTDAEWLPPTERDAVPDGGKEVTIWIVAHDERAGTDWASRKILLVP